MLFNGIRIRCREGELLQASIPDFIDESPHFEIFSRFQPRFFVSLSSFSSFPKSEGKGIQFWKTVGLVRKAEIENVGHHDARKKKKTSICEC